MLLRRPPLFGGVTQQNESLLVGAGQDTQATSSDQSREGITLVGLTGRGPLNLCVHAAQAVLYRLDSRLGSLRQSGAFRPALRQSGLPFRALGPSTPEYLPAGL